MNEPPFEKRMKDVDVSKPNSMKKTLFHSNLPNSAKKGKHDFEKDRIDNTKGSDYTVSKKATDNLPFTDNRPKVGKEKLNMYTAKGNSNKQDVTSAKAPHMREQGDMPKDYFKDNYEEGYHVHPLDKSTNKDRKARRREMEQYGVKETSDNLGEEEKKVKGRQHIKKMVNDKELNKPIDKGGYRKTIHGQHAHDTNIKHNKDDNDVGDYREAITDDLNLNDMNEYMEPNKEKKKKLKEKFANKDIS